MGCICNSCMRGTRCVRSLCTAVGTYWLLLSCVLLVSAARCQSRTEPWGSILHELSSHTHVDVTQLEQAVEPWDSILSIRRHLDGSGFHRTLALQLEATEAMPQRACQLSLLQLLPSSIFADPYQLEDLTRNGQDRPPQASSPYAYSFKLLGPLDLELPAPACEDTGLLLGLNTSLLTQQQQQQQQEPGLTLHVPLHAKYPQPLASGFHGLQWTLTGHAAVTLPWPSLLLDCRQQDGGDVMLLPPPAHLQQQQPSHVAMSARANSHTQAPEQGSSSSSSSGQGTGDDDSSHDGSVLWLVPAGNLDHEVLVSWGTLLLTALCCLAVSWAALTSSTTGHGMQ